MVISTQSHSSSPDQFKLTTDDGRPVQPLYQASPYSAAMRFLRGEFEVQGDFIAAARHYLTQGGTSFYYRVMKSLASLELWRLFTATHTPTADKRHIQSHYDRSNNFFRQFLDSRMVYSCAYFADQDMSLEDAQLAKLDLICGKLRLRPAERFLDIGCGWGALVIRAAQRFGVHATGCTLSRAQAQEAGCRIQEAGLAGSAEILELDYRNLRGIYDKIASVGMFEHVGRRRLGEYFRKVYSLLAPGGLFLNHGIVRHQTAHAGPEMFFIQRHVFPGGELVHLSDVVRTAESQGFEVLHTEGLRQHYVLTCREWVRRLAAAKEQCLKFVDERTWRTWILYLSASACHFEDGNLEVQQVLLSRKADSPWRMLPVQAAG